MSALLDEALFLMPEAEVMLSPSSLYRGPSPKQIPVHFVYMYIVIHFA